MLPKDGSHGSSDWTPSKIATTLTLYKTLLGPGGQALLSAANAQGSQTNKIDATLLNQLESKINELERKKSA